MEVYFDDLDWSVEVLVEVVNLSWVYFYCKLKGLFDVFLSIFICNIWLKYVV